ncbi:MAG: Y-family DNA polymerase [Desulfobacterales bacterium]|nr:Y-family DNA polymerase [Desulfobacterales bacterium]
MPKVFAIVDCNNFYVSCERVFNPTLNGKPVIILSNNDGCAVSRSNEAKTIGIQMAAPVFKIRHIIKKYDVQVLSSNYALYGDMSQRVMETLSGLVPNMEIYSIDEAFLDLSAFRKQDLIEYGRKIQKTVRQWTGIPVSVGIAPTKTLAKLANHIAKKSHTAKGVVNLLALSSLDSILEKTNIEDLWGIGHRYGKFFNAHDIRNARQLRDLNETFIKSKMGVMGTRLQQELKGIPCYHLEYQPAPKQGITVSRTFQKEISNFDDLDSAIANYASRAGEKLRLENAVAQIIVVFLLTNRFRENGHVSFETVRMPVATSDTAELIHFAGEGLRMAFKKGRLYKKAGIILKAITPDKPIQATLFDTKDRSRSGKLMQALDTINHRMGCNTLKYAATGLSPKQKWQTIFNYRSPAYTTNWQQLPGVV